MSRNSSGPSLKKKFVGLIRQISQPGGSTGSNDPHHQNRPIPRPDTFIYKYLQGETPSIQPEITYGKSCEELPSRDIGPMSSKVMAAFTGPGGGLTSVNKAQRTVDIDDPDVDFIDNDDATSDSSPNSYVICQKPPPRKNPFGDAIIANYFKRVDTLERANLATSNGHKPAPCPFCPIHGHQASSSSSSNATASSCKQSPVRSSCNSVSPRSSQEPGGIGAAAADGGAGEGASPRTSPEGGAKSSYRCLCGRQSLDSLDCDVPSWRGEAPSPLSPNPSRAPKGAYLQFGDGPLAYGLALDPPGVASSTSESGTPRTAVNAASCDSSGGGGGDDVIDRENVSSTGYGGVSVESSIRSNGCSSSGSSSSRQRTRTTTPRPRSHMDNGSGLGFDPSDADNANDAVLVSCSDLERNAVNNIMVSSSQLEVLKDTMLVDSNLNPLILVENPGDLERQYAEACKTKRRNRRPKGESSTTSNGVESSRNSTYVESARNSTCLDSARNSALVDVEVHQNADDHAPGSSSSSGAPKDSINGENARRRPEGEEVVEESAVLTNGNDSGGLASQRHKFLTLELVEGGDLAAPDPDLKRSETEEIASVLNWNRPHERAFGLSTTLYECHPNTHERAGNPIADAFGLVARENSAVLALADGVNWGEKASIAARCAIHGCLHHLNTALFSPAASPPTTSTDIFVSLLRSFHAAHSLILQENGMLTTLTAAVVAPLADSNQYVICVCNVGDSLAYVFSHKYGVREITQGSHDIYSMRDMRDALGALGPVDGQNPELNNLTCSLTYCDPGDIVFLTSDGISDNFDPVVGKFAVPKKTEREREREQKNSAKEARGSVNNNNRNSSQNQAGRQGRQQVNRMKSQSAEEDVHDPFLPVVEAYQRHELTLLRMEDLLRCGLTSPGPVVAAQTLCLEMVHFVTKLTVAKRRILEDPDLYKSAPPELSRADQRNRRRKVCEKLALVPGKLDHATVVAFCVGRFEDSGEPPAINGCPEVFKGGKCLKTVEGKIVAPLASPDSTRSLASQMEENCYNNAMKMSRPTASRVEECKAASRPSSSCKDEGRNSHSPVPKTLAVATPQNKENVSPNTGPLSQRPALIETVV
ncbi:uncharacterized protein LOC143036532 [Oratosquilla oratoria]|uniref:uncharacterized protein LOC143036532 n=1 Tax=Oratosquilla oratoria TaxID=337810 RepID=UPI003F765D1A